MFRRPKVNIENLGLIPDPRPKKEKKLDYRANEIMEFEEPDWKEKSQSEWRKFPIFDQNGSSSCMAQAVCKSLGIENFIEEGKFVHFAPRDVYTRRKNAPSKGMWFQDGMRIGHEGVTFEQLMPSLGSDEKEMNYSEDRTELDKIIRKPGRGGNYLILPTLIDIIAGIIQNEKKAPVLAVSFGPGEWNRKVPVLKSDSAPYNHAITATDFLLYKGKKALLIEDSWGINSGFSGRRIVTEDWFKKKDRIRHCYYFKNLKNEGEEVMKKKPKHKFEKNLHYGLIRKDEVVWLQKCLSYLKMFPSEVDFTGNFFGITLHGVKQFQLSYRKEISDIVNYEISATGYVGPGTRGKLNQVFA